MVKHGTAQALHFFLPYLPIDEVSFTVQERIVLVFIVALHVELHVLLSLLGMLVLMFVFFLLSSLFSSFFHLLLRSFYFLSCKSFDARVRTLNAVFHTR